MVYCSIISDDLEAGENNGGNFGQYSGQFNVKNVIVQTQGNIGR